MKVDRDGTARVEFEIRFSAERKGRRRVRTKPESTSPPLKPVPPQLPRITQLLVLGYHFERLVRDGRVNNYAEIARLTGLTRARVTQILDMTLLATDIQEAILCSTEGRGTWLNQGTATIPRYHAQQVRSSDGQT